MKRFLQLVKAKVLKISSLAVGDGIALMLAFYEDDRADGCVLDADGDMLLYQWGCYDWGNGEFFELNITRQFIDGAAEDEDIRQLSLTFRFPPSADFRKAGEGNSWCRTPDDVRRFRSKIESSRAFKAAVREDAAQVTLELQGQLTLTKPCRPTAARRPSIPG